jgi:peptidoglycan/xylan/chitin deacetylase (PgdA/CDA1 family)
MLRKLPFYRSVRGLCFGLLFLGLISAVVATASAVAQFDTIPEWVVPDFLQTVKAVGPPSSTIPVPAKQEIQPYYAEKVVYLTFDDGPDPIITPLVLQTLKKYAVPATFFVVGTQIEANPELLRRINAEGHAIGNHTYNHRYKELYQSPAAYIGQLEKCDAFIQAISGVKPLISRAPGGTTGSFTSEYWAALRQEGYKDIGWNVPSGDASSAKAAQIADNVIAQTKKNSFLWSHAIVLMHDGVGHEETAAALPSIIEYFKNEGFEFRPVDLSTPPAW